MLAEADRNRCRKQFGYFVRCPEFLSSGEESTPFHQSRVRRRRRYVRPDDGPLARTTLGAREQGDTATERQPDLPGNAERHPLGKTDNHI